MQIAPFEKHGIPVFLGIGNHELVPPKDRLQYVERFAKWIGSPAKEQRPEDSGSSRPPRTYYHWH
jgi:hypothetical protein